MIWNSVPIMTTLDLVMIGVSVFAGWSYFVNRSRFRLVPFGAGHIVTLVGIAVLGVFFAADLFTMHVLPLFLPPEEAQAAMMMLHLEYSWFAVIGGATAIVVGYGWGVADLKKVEDQLRQSEYSIRQSRVQLDSAVQSFSDGFALFDADDRFVLANEPYLTTHQAVRDIQVPGTKFETIVRKLAEVGFYGNSPEEIEEWVQMRLERHRSGKSFEYEMADGRWFQVNQYTTKDGGTALVRIDITELKKAEALRLEAETRFRAVVDNSPAPLFFKDVEGRFLIANNAYEQVYGVKMEDIEGQTSRALFDEEAYEFIRRHDQEILDTRQAVSKVEDFIGREFLVTKFPVVDAECKLIGLGGIDTDISGLKQAEEALAQSEARFREFALASSDWFWETDVDGRINWESEVSQLEAWHAAESVIGRTREEIAGDLIGESDWQIYQQALREHVEFKGFEYCYVGQDGGKRYARISGNPMFAADGSYKGHRGVASNITDLKEAEESLRRAQKMEAIGQLTGGIAHDFNNLLAVMIGNADILMDKSGHDDDLRQSIDAIVRAVERGSSLTNRLLAFSRQQALQPVAADVAALIGDLEELFRRSLGETIDLRFEGADDLWPAMIDAHQFENALVNLAINARDAMTGGGVLTIEAANATLDDEYVRQQEEVAPGDYVMVAVSDTGTGMAPDVLEKAFDPFFTTKDVGEGSGLGLSMVYGFAKQSRGHVTIYSEVGHGSSIKLYLPRSRQSGGEEEDRYTAAPPERGSERILVVEDEPAVREVPVSILRSQGYDVVEAGNADEAIGHLEDGRRFDLLFTDIVLPGGRNGVAIAEAAKRLQPHIHVLYTTGYAEQAVMHTGQLDDEASVVNKPYRRVELLEKVRTILDQTQA